MSGGSRRYGCATGRPQPVAFRSCPAVIKRLEAAGAGAPVGRLYHVALETDGTIQVFDDWDSQESFDKFGETLVPILNELGAPRGEPIISTVHNIIEG